MSNYQLRMDRKKAEKRVAELIRIQKLMMEIHNQEIKELRETHAREIFKLTRIAGDAEFERRLVRHGRQGFSWQPSADPPKPTIPRIGTIEMDQVAWMEQIDDSVLQQSYLDTDYFERDTSEKCGRQLLQQLFDRGWLKPVIRHMPSQRLTTYSIALWIGKAVPVNLVS